MPSEHRYQIPRVYCLVEQVYKLPCQNFFNVVSIISDPLTCVVTELHHRDRRSSVSVNEQALVLNAVTSKLVYLTEVEAGV